MYDLDSKPTDGQSAARYDNAKQTPQRAATQPHQNMSQRPNMTQPLTGGGEYIDGDGIRQTTPQFPQMDETDEIPF